MKFSYRYSLGLPSQRATPRLLLATAILLTPPMCALAQTDCTNSVFSNNAACQTSQQSPALTQSPQGQGQDLGQSGTQIPASTTQRGADNSRPYIDLAGMDEDAQSKSAQSSQQYRLPPDPVTDLQKLTRSSTGQNLPVFGRDLFQRSPSTFAPVDQVPMMSDYAVGPGDVVLVRIAGADQISSNNQLTVDASGNIYLPRVGAIQVAGLKASELQARISADASRFFRNYQLSVTLGKLRSIQIYVVGEARRPGAYTVSALSTALNALFASGGPNAQGSMRHIQVRRGDGTASELDLYDLILRGDKSKDVRLQSGDTLFIPPVGTQVALAGSVRRPAIYELKDDAGGQAGTSLNDLLTLGGGFGPTANPKQIGLERIGADLQRHSVTVALDGAGRAMLLRDGDVLYVNHIAPGFEKTVTVRGNLANPGRFAWTPGMHLSDIIPDRESLLTGDYWRERNRLGVPVPLFEPYELSTPPPGSGGATTDPSTMHGAVVTLPNGQLKSSHDALTQVLPPSVPGQETQEQQASLATAGVQSNSATELDRSAMTEVNHASLPLANQTSVTGVNQAATMAGSQAPTTEVNRASLLRSQQPPADQQVIATRTPDIIRIPAPEIDWSYAVVERLDPITLKSVLVPFHLGKLVQEHDTNQNLELQPGDVVTILNQRDILVPQAEQTKYVRLEGEFAGAGVYSAKPGETLDQLVKRAGGLTSGAYLYGSSFQRESTRVFQQQRLDDYITKLSADMDRQTAVRGASTQTGISDPNALVLEKNMIAQLRELRATGRIVFEFTPTSANVEDVPHIALENGDVFRVPSRPSTVSVIGAVYGQNVFLYDAKRHLDDYLSLAGRPNRIADKSHAFIIRADGSVYSRELANSFLSNRFDSSHIYPGDAIVIPEKPISPNVTKRLLDYSQLLSSFGLAAAALAVIKNN